MPLDISASPQSKNKQKQEAPKLYCRHCGQWITQQDWAISIKQGHEHTVFNPAGMVFNIGCFRDAPGCITSGNPSSDFSWFSGYKWQITHCRGCATQLGWTFTAPLSPPMFFGLIFNRMSNNQP